MAWSEVTGQTGTYPITEVWVNNDPVTGFVVIDGEAIATTPNHPFFTVERGWIGAGQLRVGDHVLSMDGHSGVVSAVEWERGPGRMYDLTVAVAHTFFVGEGEWLVHNRNCPRVSHPRNRSSWAGDTDVYAIRDGGGRLLKIGESATGRTRTGLSRRGQQQVAKLGKLTGGRFTSEIRKTLPGKAAAVSYQSRLIERFRRRYGRDTLPLNFNGR
jgi:hypothetical protein